MLQSKLGRALLITLVGTAVAAVTFAGCGGRGNTDGGSENSGIGEQFVSDGGAGATIRIDILGSLTVGNRVDFIVTLLDPQGNPIPFIRIFCESEAGIAILEPSRGGVAFESTAANGIMSGVLGGVTPGSYLLECRAEQGFNLVDRESIIITGDVPSDFEGFPGAAGGNLGGQLLLDEPREGGLAITNIQFSDVTGDTRTAGLIDLRQIADCDGDPMTTDDAEPFGFDDVLITVNNPFNELLTIDSITYTASDPTIGPIMSVLEPAGLGIPAESSATVQTTFTDFSGGFKSYVGSGVAIYGGACTNTTYPVSFTISLTGAESGDSFTLTDGATITSDCAIDNC